jgi:hypothetical protein
MAGKKFRRVDKSGFLIEEKELQFYWQQFFSFSQLEIGQVYSDKKNQFRRNHWVFLFLFERK